MTEFVLYGIIILALATIYTGVRKPGRLLFDKVCDAFLLFSCLNALYVIIIRVFLDSGGITDAGSPFILGYGAFFYMGLKSLTEGELKKKDILLHYAPLMIFTFIYIIIMSDEVLREMYFVTYYVVLYSVSILSLICYTLVAIFSNSEDTANDIINREKKQLVRVSGFALGSMALLFLLTAVAGLFSEEGIKNRLPGTILYSGLLVSIGAAFVYRINNLIEDAPVIAQQIDGVSVSSAMATPTPQQDSVAEIKKGDAEEVLKVKKESAPAQKYNKSALSPAVLEDYRVKLDNLIDIEKVYLDNELTLEVLAKKMKMPMHHLTQLFNMHLGENFNQYINKFRIDYACRLLETNDGSMSIEQIAFNSGFNSKVSFNRHFKNITGVTPKEYAYSNKSSGVG